MVVAAMSDRPEGVLVRMLRWIDSGVGRLLERMGGTEQQVATAHSTGSKSGSRTLSGLFRRGRNRKLAQKRDLERLFSEDYAEPTESPMADLPGFRNLALSARAHDHRFPVVVGCRRWRRRLGRRRCCRLCGDDPWHLDRDRLPGSWAGACSDTCW
jgi:hypothetical protein